jgi:hypothetical protein
LLPQFLQVLVLVFGQVEIGARGVGVHWNCKQVRLIHITLSSHNNLEADVMVGHKSFNVF